MSRMTDEEVALVKASPAFAAIEDFYATASDYREFGATDTEPRANFEEYMEQVFHGKEPLFGEEPVKCPRSARDWELYTSSMKCGQAARALTRAASAAAKVVRTEKRKNPNKTRLVARYYGFVRGCF